jgi:Domain of unknown function (DUF4396)
MDRSMDHEHMHHKIDHENMDHGMDHENMHHNMEHQNMHHHHDMHHDMHHDKNQDMHYGMHHSDVSAPFYISVLIGVTHCGAGCVLGDIVGEWIVYGTNVMINGRNLWPEMLIGI